MDGLELDRRLLEQLCEWSGLSPSRLGDEAGLASTTITRSTSGVATSRLSSTTLDKLRARFPDFPGWLKSAASDKRLPFRGFPQEAAAGMVEIDSIDFAFGMGGTFLDASDAEVVKVQFNQQWLRSNVSYAPPELLGVATGVGDSMEPILYDRDLVFFDRSARLEDHLGDKMWVFAYGQIGMIKRLRPLPDGTVKIMSANRTYPDEIAGDGEIHIIGRVVASLRRH